jgi:hypothetical protein
MNENEPASPQDRTRANAEGGKRVAAGKTVAIGFLIAIGAVLFLVGMIHLFLVGKIHPQSLVGPLPDLGQSLGA